MREIAFEHGVPRETRKPRAQGRRRRDSHRSTGADIDVALLWRPCIDERHTIPEIAAEVGVTRTTINRHLKDARIPRRASGSASRATIMRVDPRDADLPLLRRMLV